MDAFVMGPLIDALSRAMLVTLAWIPSNIAFKLRHLAWIIGLFAFGLFQGYLIYVGLLVTGTQKLFFYVLAGQSFLPRGYLISLKSKPAAIHSSSPIMCIMLIWSVYLALFLFIDLAKSVKMAKADVERGMWILLFFPAFRETGYYLMRRMAHSVRCAK